MLRGGLRGELRDVREELRGELREGVRGELREEELRGGLRQDLRGEIREELWCDRRQELGGDRREEVMGGGAGPANPRAHRTLLCAGTQCMVRVVSGAIGPEAPL